jgi:hypothetical protein
MRENSDVLPKGEPLEGEGEPKAKAVTPPLSPPKSCWINEQ